MVGPNGDGTLSTPALAAILDYIRARPQIWEVILTGGDPFMLSSRRMHELTKALAAIPHVKIARWHTRVPVAAPERLTPALITSLKAKGLTTYVAIHINHADELTPNARAAIAKLIAFGIGLVSQSVLLKGVNDTVDALEHLMRALVEVGIKPYYLHHPDLAPGTGHFRISLTKGQRLISALRRRLSGLAMPHYMLDVPDGAGKVPIHPSHLSVHNGTDQITTLHGHTLPYPPSGAGHD